MGAIEKVNIMKTMKFSNELADLIISANNLKPVTKRAWKRLGRIPNKYKPGYQTQKKTVTFSLDRDLAEKLPAKKSELVNRLLRAELG